MPDPDIPVLQPPSRTRVRRSAAFLRHTIEHEGVEDQSAADQVAIADVLFGAEQWCDAPDPDAGSVFGIPTSTVRHQFELAQSLTGEADPNLAMLAALRRARDASGPSDRARIAEAQGMVAPESADVESVVMAARQARQAQVALEHAKDEAQVAPDTDLAGWLAARRDWVPPDMTAGQGAAVLAPGAVSALDGLCAELDLPLVREGVDAVALFERAAQAARAEKVADRVSASARVRRVRERGGGTRSGPVDRGGVSPKRRLALAMGDDPASTADAVMSAAAEWFEVNGPKLRTEHAERVGRVSGEPGSGPADAEGTAHVHGRASGGVSEEVALVALLQTFDGEWQRADDPKRTAMVSLPRDTVDRARRFIADTVGWPGYEADRAAAQALAAVRDELGALPKNAEPSAVVRRAVQARELARRFGEVAGIVSEDAHYGDLVVSRVRDAWQVCRELVPMIAEHCTEDEALDGPSVEALERALRELLGRAARCAFAEETVMLARVACGQGDQVVAEHVEMDGNGSFATASEAVAADAGAWAVASRTVLAQHVEEAHAAWKAAPGLHGELDGIRVAVDRLLGFTETTADNRGARVAEVTDLVAQLRERVSPGSPSAVGVLYAARNRLAALEEASPELVEAQARHDAHRANMRDIGELVGVGPSADGSWDALAVRNAVAEAVADRDRAQAANRSSGDLAAALGLRDIARIVGVVLDGPNAPGVDAVTEAVRAVAVKAKARTTVVATALVPGPGSRESRAVSQHVLHVEPGCPDANVDLTVPWGVLDGRFGPTGSAWRRVADRVRGSSAGPLTDAVVERMIGAALDTDRSVRTALVEWVTDDVDPDGAWEMTPERVGETVYRLVSAERARLSSPSPHAFAAIYGDDERKQD